MQLEGSHLSQPRCTFFFWSEPTLSPAPGTWLSLGARSSWRVHLSCIGCRSLASIWLCLPRIVACAILRSRCDLARAWGASSVCDYRGSSDAQRCARGSPYRVASAVLLSVGISPPRSYLATQNAPFPSLGTKVLSSWAVWDLHSPSPAWTKSQPSHLASSWAFPRACASYLLQASP